MRFKEMSNIMQTTRKLKVRFASSPISLGTPTPTKTYASFILCHSLPFFNDNQDTWTAATLRNSYSSLIDHPTNIEHVQTRICGHIYDAVMVEATEDTPACIVAASVIYNHVYPDITQELSSDKNPWSVSMECMFSNMALYYDDKLYTDANDPFVNKLLENLHGSYNNKPVVRVIGGEEGEVIFAGAALTEAPADRNAVVLDVATASAVKSLERHLEDIGMPVGIVGAEPIILPGSSKFGTVGQLEKVVAHLEEGVDEVIIDRGGDKKRVICHLECPEAQEAEAQMDVTEEFDLTDVSVAPEGERLRPTLCMLGHEDCMNFDPTEPKDGCANAVATDDHSCANYRPGFPLLFSSGEEAEAKLIREVYPLFTSAYWDFEIAVYVDGDAEGESEFVAVIYHFQTIEIYERKAFTSLADLKAWLKEALVKIDAEMEKEFDEKYSSETAAAIAQLEIASIAENSGMCSEEFESFVRENNGLTDANLAYKLIKAQETAMAHNSGEEVDESLLQRGIKLLEEGIRRIRISHYSSIREEIENEEDNTVGEDTSEGGESNMPEDIQQQVNELQRELSETKAASEQQQVEIAALSDRVNELTAERDTLQTQLDEVSAAQETLAAEKESVEQEYASFKAEIEKSEQERIIAARMETRWSALQDAGLYANAEAEVQERVCVRIATMEDAEFEEYVADLLAAMPAQAAAGEADDAEEQEPASEEPAQGSFTPEEDPNYENAAIRFTDPLGNKRTGEGLNVEAAATTSIHNQFEKLHGARVAQ
jgi:hypothetical protein